MIAKLGLMPLCFTKLLIFFDKSKFFYIFYSKKFFYSKKRCIFATGFEAKFLLLV